MPYDIIIGRSDSEKKRFLNKGLINLGKGYVKMGNYNSLSNKILLDVAKSHVVLVAGKRGSGKSYTLGVMAEEISSLDKEISKNIAPLIFDTMGIYWTMKYSNEKDKALLSDWNLKPKKVPVKVFVPFGYYEKFRENGVPVDHAFSIGAEEMAPEDWILTFELDLIEPTSVLIQNTLQELKIKKKEFTIQDIINEIKQKKDFDKNTVHAAVGLFNAADSWGVFRKEGTENTKISDLVTGGETSILDLSAYNSTSAFNVRALVISLISKKLFMERTISRKLEEVKALETSLSFSETIQDRETPLVWLFIDEAHEFLPKDEKIISTDALVQILREGRQPGISIVLATQQPGKIHTDVMTQSDIVISHRVTSKQDVEALNHIMQSYLTDDIQTHMNNLPSEKGSAILLDDNSERIYPLKIRPRFTWHGGEAPNAVGEKKEF